ncbi:MAG: L,D-transpeptidase family protein [Lachnospiraceae bacterium]|nr:L,D-transpeptidase family protein [Lachnospiraceae bacterium]
MNKSKYITILFFIITISIFSPIKAHAIETFNNINEPAITNIILRSKSSFNVTLSRVSDVDGYYIYNIEDDGSLTLLKTVNDNYTSHVTLKGMTYGRSYRLTVKAYKLSENGEIITSNYDPNGITKKLNVSTRYKKGLKYYYDADGKIIKDVEHFLPKKRKYMIKVNTKKCVVTVYAKDGRKGYRIPVKSFICSPGKYTSSGTFTVGEKYRYRSLFYNSYSQWTAVIHGNILFHTTPYKSYGNNNSLDVAEYNKLGTPASHGCIRLQCEAVKWIYDNCKRGTKVVIYRSKNSGPFGKPKFAKLPKWHKWDPTDPTAIKKCQKHNCKHL